MRIPQNLGLVLKTWLWIWEIKSVRVAWILLDAFFFQAIHRRKIKANPIENQARVKRRYHTPCVYYRGVNLFVDFHLSFKPLGSGKSNFPELVCQAIVPWKVHNTLGVLFAISLDLTLDTCRPWLILVVKSQFSRVLRAEFLPFDFLFWLVIFDDNLATFDQNRVWINRPLSWDGISKNHIAEV